MPRKLTKWSSVAVFAIILTFAAVAAPNVDVAEVLLGGGQVEWVATQGFAGFQLTVSGPGGVTHLTFGPGENPRFDLAALTGEIDGLYNWELTARPLLDETASRALAEARVKGQDGNRTRPASLPPRESLIQTGSFRVVDSAIVQPAEEVENTQPRRVVAAANRALDETVISGDLTVYNALCVGFDCATAETYGADSIRLKENNLRIHFDDTSNSGSFPRNDWRLVANDQANGGRNVFYLEDSTTGREVLSVEAAAPSNALWVDSTGFVGFGTSTPVLQLHIKDGNTPGVRLEQDTSSGFAAQTWDVAGNEANFFVRSATTGSQLPFRIRPGAPSSSIDIAADGDVGIGSASPQQRLHITDTTSTDGAKIFFQSDPTDNTIGHTLGVRSDAQSEDLQAESRRNWIMMVDSNNDSANASMIVSRDGDPNSIIFHVKEDSTAGFFRSSASHPIHVGTDSTNGNGAHVTAGGAWMNGSSRASKTEVTDLSLEEAMAALQQLSPVRFRYLGEPDEQYVGFIAEDVPELVAQGDRATLGAMDIVAVLTRVVQTQQQAIESLRAELEQQKSQAAKE